MQKLENKKILVTGGAGFIGSNLIERFVQQNNKIVCLDNLSTGKRENVEAFLSLPNYEFIEGDITCLETCKRAVKGCDVVLHQAALGSVPRSIENPIRTNQANIDGFLNMLVAAKDEGIKRFVYAASSSTYGDSKGLPKVEDNIGNPLSPYAITKYVNELYADVFSKTYGIEVIGLRYFNVFGRRQDPEGAYAAVIPKFVKLFMAGESPVINGDGSFSRDFTYIDNVIQANELAASTLSKEAVNQVYNVACGGNTSLNEMVFLLRDYLSEYDANISKVEPVYGNERVGDIPHSLASIDKAKELLKYNPEYDFSAGLKKAVSWYWKNIK